MEWRPRKEAEPLSVLRKGRQRRASLSAALARPVYHSITNSAQSVPCSATLLCPVAGMARISASSCDASAEGVNASAGGLFGRVSRTCTRTSGARAGSRTLNHVTELGDGGCIRQFSGLRTRRAGATTCRSRCDRVARDRATGTCPRGRLSRAHRPSRCGTRGRR
jgi:hypothetical protein